MRGHFTQQQRVCHFSAVFAHGERRQARTGAHADWHQTLQVRQPEVARSIAAEIGPEDRKQRGILADGQNLTVAWLPAHGGEEKAKASYFTKKGVHRELLLSFARRRFHRAVPPSGAAIRVLTYCCG